MIQFTEGCVILFPVIIIFILIITILKLFHHTNIKVESKSVYNADEIILKVKYIH